MCDEKCDEQWNWTMDVLLWSEIILDLVHQKGFYLTQI